MVCFQLGAIKNHYFNYLYLSFCVCIIFESGGQIGAQLLDHALRLFRLSGNLKKPAALSANKLHHLLFQPGVRGAPVCIIVMSLSVKNGSQCGVLSYYLYLKFPHDRHTEHVIVCHVSIFFGV